MYNSDACYALCVAIVDLAWRDLRNGYQDAGEFLLRGWVTRAMDVDMEAVEKRVSAMLKGISHDQNKGG